MSPKSVGDRGTLIPRPSGTPFERGKARDDGKERERAVKKGSDNNRCRVRERQRPTGLGAWARPTWGRWFDGLTNHGRLVRLALDVGLDSLVLSYQEERTRKTAATDANHRAGQRGHDLAARISHHTHIQGVLR